MLRSAWLEKTDTLRELGELGTHANATGIASHHDELAIQRATTTLSELTQRAVSLLSLLEQLDQNERTLDINQVDSWFGDHTPVLSTPRLGDVCFAAAFELKRALSELKTAASTEERVMAVEAGHRKLRRAARAVLGTQTSDTSAAADADASCSSA